jgi:hypothetical protein
MKCKKCGGETEQDTPNSLCPACSKEEEAGARLFRRLLIFLCAVAAGMILLIIFSTPRKPDPDPAASPDAEAAPAAQSPVPEPATPDASVVPPATPEKQQWDYDTFTTDAGSKTVKVGCLRSDEMVTLNSPYSDVFAHLCFRSDGSVFLGLMGDGQLLSGDEHGARVRIGNGPVRSFSLVEAADYSSNLAFIEPHGALFAAAAAGKQIFIEATYYDAGQQTATFSPSEPLKLN